MAFMHADSFAFCQVCMAPLKAEPSHRSEMVSQLLFGERVILTGRQDDLWVEVESGLDAYRGWCLMGQLQSITKVQFRKPIKKWVGLGGAVLSTSNGKIQLYAGSDVSLINKKATLAEDPVQKVKGSIRKSDECQFSKEYLQLFTETYLHAPYLWGGKTKAGIDCSGLTQMFFRLSGIALPRDAYQQAEEGETIYFLNEVQPGDVAFFDNDEGRINHVGLLLSQESILHATGTAGKVVVDKIDQDGIISVAMKKRTHKLRIIKRYGAARS